MGTEAYLEWIQAKWGDTEIMRRGTNLKSREIGWLVKEYVGVGMKASEWNLLWRDEGFVPECSFLLRSKR